MPDPAYQPSAAKREKDLTGTQVGRFFVTDRLGHGGMGEVYRAEDSKLRRTVAIKRLSPMAGSGPEEVSRLLREGQRASALNHPNIASIYDVLEENGEVLLVMEYVQGQTLRERLSGPMKPQEFLPIALECAAALTAAHEKGILHSDIKPENIMLTPDGHVKLLDFGVARRVATANDTTRSMSLQNLSIQAPVGGTPAYMAPEVLLGGTPDLRADVFGLGMVLYEMLAGKHPFRGDASTTPVAFRIVQENAAPLPALEGRAAQPLKEVVARCMQRDPAMRYPSARPLHQDLLAIAEGARPKFAGITVRQNRARALTIFAGLTIAILLGLVLLIAPLRARLAGILHRQTATQTGAIQPSQQNLVLLPVSVAGDDPKLQAFADGLAANLISKLSQVSENHELEVVSSNQVRDKKVTTPQQAFQQFGANLALQINLQQASDLVRASYTMVESKSGRTLAGDTVTAPASDPFSLQDKVAAGVVNALKIQLRPDEQTAITTHGTAIPAAYQYYLTARGFLQDTSSRPEHIDEALAVLGEALKLDPNFGAAHASRGEALWIKYLHTREKKWIADARAECQQAISIGNAGSRGHICLGTVLEGTGKYNDAVTEFQRALELDPTDDDAYIGLARVYTSLNKPSEAEKTYQRAIELRPNYYRPYSSLAFFYIQQAEYAKAAEIYSKLISLAPENPEAYSNLGAAYLFLGRDAEAVKALQRSVQIRPSAGAYSNLGTAEFRLRRFEDAAKDYKEALKFDEKTYYLWGNLGDAYYYAGQKSKAKECYNNFLKLALPQLETNPDDAGLESEIAVGYSILGDRDQALKHLSHSLQHGGSDKDLYFNAAITYNQLGESDVSLEWLRKAVSAGYSVANIQTGPAFDNLRNDQRFASIMSGAPH